MRKIVCLAFLVAAGMLLASCGEQAGSGNGANKPANAPGNNATKPAADTATIEADIKKMLASSAEALSGPNAADSFERTTTDSYMFIGPDGAVATRADRAKSLRSGDSKYESLKYDDVRVRVNPEGTGAVSISTVTVKGTNMGQKVDGAYRSTHVWSKTPDGWKLAHGHVTAMTAKEEPKTDAAKDDKAAEEKK